MRIRGLRQIPALAATILAVAVGAVSAQERIDGALQSHDVFGRAVSPDEIKVFHDSEFKGAHRVAISVFDVAFPSENHFTANTRVRSSFGGLGAAASASMKTTMTGVDHATQQRIADRAYALFVAQLTAAGYDVVDQAELTRLAPEFGTWASLPNFSQGRFGAYVAPTGQSLRFLQGDAAKRDTSGMFGQQASAFRVLDMPQAFARSPYLAHDGGIGVIAVTLVVDYGVYSSTGERNRMGSGRAKAGFLPGVTIAAGDVGDHGSLVEYWGPKSGGFPAVALLQQPVRSERTFGEVNSEGAVDAAVVADPAQFEAAAGDVLAIAVPKLVSAMAAAR